MLKRLFDIICSLIGILLLIPFFVIIILIQIISSGFPVFYFQTRVGENNIDFKHKDRWGNTALDDAIKYKRDKIIKVL